jgi:nucleotide-binding universal stress UspA family protein
MPAQNAPSIICGTDFSECSKIAGDAAVAIASKWGEDLTLIHASVIPGSPLTQEHLETERHRLAANGANIHAEIIEGNADEVLTKAAGQAGRRLLVVSSLGRRGPSRWLLGSTAERTAEAATLPTLIVRDPAPFQAWARGERPLRIFLGVDFSATSTAALQWVAEFKKTGPCEITVAYCDWPPEETARLGSKHVPGFGNPLEVQQVLERELREKVTPVLGTDNVTLIVQASWGRVDARLTDLATKSGADLLVVGTHQRHGLGRLGSVSVSRGLIHHSSMNVICVPAQAAKRIEGPMVQPCQRILVAVDLNEPHGFVVPYALGLCQRGGTVRILHVSSPQTAKGDIAALESALRSLIPADLQQMGISVELEVVQDENPSEAICAAAERFSADLLCVGSHTRPGFKAKVLGSVSLGVLQTSPRPVLVVRPPAK